MTADHLSAKHKQDADHKEFRQAFEAYAKAHEDKRLGEKMAKVKPSISPRYDDQTPNMTDAADNMSGKANTQEIPSQTKLSRYQDSQDVTPDDTQKMTVEKPTVGKDGQVESESETLTFLRNRLEEESRENRALTLRLSAYAQEMARMVPTLDNLINPSEQEQNHLQQIAETNPHMAKIIQDRFAKLSAMEKRLEGLVMAEERRQQQEEIDKNKAKLDKAFPDWETIVENGDFIQWAKQQNPAVKRLLNTGDSDDLVTVIELFKAADRQDPDHAEAERRKKLRRSVQMTAATRVPPNGLDSRLGLPDDFTAAFDYYAQKHEAERKSAP